MIQRAKEFTDEELPFLTVASETIWTDPRPQILVSKLAGTADAKGAIQVAQSCSQR